MAYSASNYNCCLYCGRVNGYANPEMPPYCNLACQFKARDEEPLDSKTWQENFEASVVEFNRRNQERREEYRLRALRKQKIGDSMPLELQPVTRDEASAYVEQLHRHHEPPVSWKFGIAVNDGSKVVGVIMVGRPVARHLDNGWTLEVTRCCTDGTKNACSMLYASAWRAARALGYKRLITYTLPEEGGASLKGAGWKVVGETKGGSWSRPSRPRVDTHPLQGKLIWEAV